MPTRTRRSYPAKLGSPMTKKVTAKLYTYGEMDAEEQLIDDLEVVVFETEPAYVRVNGGYTDNLGDFRSLRIDVSISVPCYQELVTETFEEIAAQVNDLLIGEVARFRKSVREDA